MTPPTSVDAIRRLLSPTSIAVVGPSDDPQSPRGRALRYPLESRFAGPVYAIHPHKAAVQGVLAHRSLLSLGEQVDVALIAVPAAAVPEVISDCAAAGVRAAVVFASGFAEIGDAGRALQEQVLAEARRGSVRLLGPNCLGIINFVNGIPLTTASQLSEGAKELPPGRLAIISQSGAMGSFMLASAVKLSIGLSHFLSMGNEADLEWSDFAFALADDPDVSVVAGYLEAIRNPQQFIAALEALRSNGKHVVVLKAGRSQRGVEAAASHTGALATDDGIFQAVLDSVGAHRVTDLRALIAKAHVLTGKAARGRRVALASASGGLAAVLADQADALDLELPRLSDELQARLRDRLPAYGATTSNPIDFADSLSRDGEAVTEHVVGALLHSGEVDAVGFFMGSASRLEDPLTNALSRASERSSTPLVTTWIGGTGAFVRAMNARGVASFQDPTDAMLALEALADAADSSPELVNRPRTAFEPADQSLLQSDLLEALMRVGLPVVKRWRFATGDRLRAFLENGTGRYVLKAHLPGVAHKADIGAVVGPVTASDAAEIELFVRKFKNADSFEAQAAVSADWELIVGVKRDPEFGLMAIVGYGGMLANAIKNTQIFLYPMSLEFFERKLIASEMSTVLEGFRGLVAVGARELLQVIDQMVAFVEVNGLSVLEVNPMMVERGSGALVAVDALAE